MIARRSQVAERPHVAPTVAPSRTARAVIRPLVRAWMRLDVEAAHHVASAGPVIIASTHRSHADSVALGGALERPVHFLGDVQLVRWPIVGPWLPRLGMVPIRRGQKDTAALAQLRVVLDDGHALVIYPEGSRSRDGRVYRCRSGVARLAAVTGVPVVPAAVLGTERLWPAGRAPRLRGAITVRFGPALAAPAADPRARRAFSELLHSELVRLSGAPSAEEFAAVAGGAAA